MAIKIVIDSTCNLPEELIREYDLSIISLSVVYEGESHREIDLDLKTFYEKLPNFNKIPTSSQPSMEDMYHTFEKHINDGNEVLSFFISSGLSGTYSTSMLVRESILEEYPNARLEIVDSKSASMETGFLVIASAKAAREGKTMDEILEIIKYTMRCTRYMFVPFTLEYLRKGGRIGNASSLIGNLLSIRPVLTVVDGTVEAIAKIRTQKKALEFIIDVFKKDIEEHGFIDAVIHHINCEAEAAEFAQKIELLVGKKLSLIAISAVVGVHVGPGTYGIAYCTQNPMR